MVFVLLVLVVLLAAAALAILVTHVVAGAGAARAGVALAGLAIVVVLTLGAVGGLRGGGDPPSSPVPTAVSEGPTTAPSRGSTPLRPADIHLVSSPAGALPPVPAVMGDLDDGEAIVVGLAGLDPHSHATVHQCPTAAPVASACRAGLPITASGAGRATVLVDLQDRLDVGSGPDVDCRESAVCSIVVFGSARLEVVTVFGRPASPPIRVRAAPARIPVGGTVTATAERLAPGTAVSFVVCRPSEPGEVDCGAPAAPVRVDRAGQATGPVRVGAGRCPRGATCAVGVVSGDGGPLAFARLQLIGRSGAAYAAGRVQAGLVGALVLLCVAAWLLRRTDWTPVEGDPFADVHIPEDPFADVPGP